MTDQTGMRPALDRGQLLTFEERDEINASLILGFGDFLALEPNGGASAGSPDDPRLPIVLPTHYDRLG